MIVPTLTFAQDISNSVEISADADRSAWPFRQTITLKDPSSMQSGIGVLSLPPEVFASSEFDGRDIRLLFFSADSEPIEVPYIVKYSVPSQKEQKFTAKWFR